MKDINKKLTEEKINNSLVESVDNKVEYRDIFVSSKESNDPKGTTDTIDEIEKQSVLCYYFPLGANPIKVFIKKVIRKLVGFIIKPLLEQQNKVNKYVVKAFRETMVDSDGRITKSFFDNQEKKISDLENKIAILEEELSSLKKDNK